MLSIIIPALNEQDCIEQCLQALQPLREKGHEVIVADGGSQDNTVKLSVQWADRVIQARRGRARQMNAGAGLARGDVLLFLHADTLLPDNAVTAIGVALHSGNHHWGRFNIKLSGSHWLLRLIETMMNCRSRLTGIATGDQAMFVRRNTFIACSGYPDIPLMEDIGLSKRLKGYGSPACLRPQVISSSRRWEQHGMLATIVLMWRLRLAYFLGHDPRRLAQRYQ